MGFSLSSLTALSSREIASASIYARDAGVAGTTKQNPNPLSIITIHVSVADPRSDPAQHQKHNTKSADKTVSIAPLPGILLSSLSHLHERPAAARNASLFLQFTAVQMTIDSPNYGWHLAPEGCRSSSQGSRAS